MEPLLCFGHRCAAGHEPENTLLAVERGFEFGADWIQIDVHAIEEKCAVIRDERLERTTNGHGNVDQKSWEYIRSLAFCAQGRALRFVMILAHVPTRKPSATAFLNSFLLTEI
jgi:glycerophosphoryl diester phosphodiesterase